MKTKIIFTTLIIAMMITTVLSCKKEGTGGKAIITGYIKHHSAPIPNATVYIKYGAKESAGISPSNYDASVTAGADAKYEFKELNKGDYYVFSVGYDSAISNAVVGGIPVTIKKKTETVNANIPVVE
ncbi:MAG: hypothetical protein WC150_01485 [Bacteroidia bacterium]